MADKYLVLLFVGPTEYVPHSKPQKSLFAIVIRLVYLAVSDVLVVFPWWRSRKTSEIVQIKRLMLFKWVKKMQYKSRIHYDKLGNVKY